jgi:predicted TIM-barrel fold metal-dependent hydrolase
MTESSPKNYIVVSTDGHCGADLRAYKPYLESRYHDRFDEWADSYHDMWAQIDEANPIERRVGHASFEAPLNWESAKRLKHTEDEGIAVETLFPNTSPPFFPSGSISAPGPRSAEEYELRFAGLKAHNRWLADFCQDAPGRRVGIAQVFLDDVDAAIEEVTWAKEAGLKGVLLPGDHTLKMVNLYYPRYDPLWEVCADLGLPVHRHGVTPCETAQEGGPAAPWVGSFEGAFYMTRAISHVITAGVFERFPNLKFVTTEALTGFEIPSYLAKLDGMFYAALNWKGTDTRMVEAASRLTRKPSEYFATNCFMAGPLDLPACLEVGTPNLMFGADIPHAEGTSPYTHEALRRIFSDVPEPETRKILGSAAIQVYDLDEAVLQKVADRIGPTVEEVATPLSKEEWPAYPTESRCPMFATGTDPRFASTASSNREQVVVAAMR